MKQPCDDALLRAGVSDTRCRAESAPWVLAASILGSSMAFIDSSVVNVALPALQSTFHASITDIQWVVESYGLFLSALILVGGALGDSIGRRRVFLLGVTVFALGSVGCGLSSQIWQLIAARCAQGIGAAALVPSSLALVSAAYDDKSRGQAIGTWSGFTAITTAIGPVLGGWLIEHVSWHWIFFINVPVGLALVAITLLYVPEFHKAGVHAVDYVGALVVTAGLAGFVYGFIESSTLGWRHPVVISSLIVGFGCLVGFIFVEQRVATPMMPLSLFSSVTFSGANLLTFLLYAAIGVFFFVLPLNLIQIQGYSATAAGAAALPLILLMFFLSRWGGGLVTRYGPRTPLVIGPLIVAAGFLLFAVPLVGHNYWTMYFPAFVVLGLGMAISVPPLTTVVMNSVDEDRVGAASGINNAVARVAGVLAIAILGVVMVRAFGHKLDGVVGRLNLAPDVLSEIRANVIELGGLKVPPNLEPSTTAMIKTAIWQGFVFAFRLIMLICSGLAAASAAVALRTIPSQHPKQLKESVTVAG